LNSLNQLLQLLGIPQVNAENDILNAIESIGLKLNEDKAMLVFCRVETLKKNDREHFKLLVSRLIEQKNVCILFTDSISNPAINGSFVHPLKPLNYESTIKLFMQYSSLSRADQMNLRTLLTYDGKYFDNRNRYECSILFREMGAGIPLLVQQKACCCKTLAEFGVPFLTENWLRRTLEELERRKQEDEA